MPRFQGLNVTPAQGTTGQAGAQAVFSQVAGGVSDLAARLQAFSKKSLAEAGALTQQQAAIDATLDISKRKAKIAKIRDTILDPKQQQVEIDKLIEGKRREDNTIYSNAYNNAANSAYANQIIVDAKSAADIATVEAKGSKDSFAEIYQQFERETVKNAPTKELAIIAKRSFLQYGSGAYKSLGLSEFRENEKRNKEAYSSAVKQFENDYLEATRENDIVKQGDTFSKYIAASQSAIKSGYTTPEQVNFEISRINKLAFTERNMEGFRTSDDRVSFLKTFRENKELNEEETAAAISRMHNMMKSEQEDIEIIERAEEREDRRSRKETKRGLDIALVSGELSRGMIEEAVKGKAITLTEADSYLERAKTLGITKTDTGAYLNMFNNLDITSETQIMNNAFLSDEDKLELLKEKEANEKLSNAEAEKLGKWQLTVNGKQAISSIRNHFGIFEGTLMAKIDIENQLGKDFIKIQRKHFDEVQRLPLEERGLKSLDIADRLLMEYEAGEIQGTQPFINKKSATIEEEQSEPPKAEEIRGQGGFIKFVKDLL